MSELYDGVRRLLRANVASYEELDALLLCASGARTVFSVAQALRIRDSDASLILERLAAARLLGVSSSDGTTMYRCDPVDRDLARAVKQIAELNETNRVKLIGLMAETAIDRLRERAPMAFELFAAGRSKEKL